MGTGTKGDIEGREEAAARLWSLGRELDLELRGFGGQGGGGSTALEGKE